jgi:PAS domain S-box-containing protein
MEWTAVCMGTFTAVLGVLYLRHKSDYVVVVIAITMCFVGSMDAFHTLAADRLVEASADNRSLVPLTSALSRFSNSLLLGIGCSILLLSKRIRPRRPDVSFLIVLAIGLVALAYWIVHFYATREKLPEAYFPQSFITRPWDLPALILFAVSGIFLFPPLLRRYPGLFSHALLLSVFPHITSQLHMTLGSTQIYDSHFHIAHLLKIVAYLVPLSALCLYFIHSLRSGLGAIEQLEKATEGLRQEASKRAQVERKLRSQEMRLTQLTDSIREVFWIAAPRVGEWIYVSPAYEEIFDRSCESLYRDPWSILDAIHPDDRDHVRTLLEQDVQGDFGFDFRIKRSDDQIRWIQTRAFPVRNKAGEVYRVAGISEDVTQQKDAEEALRRTEARNEALVNALPDLIFRLSRDGVILDYRAKDHSELRFQPQEFLGRKVWDLLPELEDRAKPAAEKALETDTVQIIEYPLEMSGQLREYEARFVRSGEDEVLAIIRDITEHKHLEREILDISSREQQRIGHDLHDGLSQQLAGIALLGKVLHQRLETKSLPEAADAMRIVDLVKEAITQTRSLAHGLSPIQLDSQGLPDALEELALWVENLHSVDCRFRCDQEIRIDDLAAATNLYRIAQESVSNALKHGDPSYIEIELSSRNGLLTLTIRDNGTGLPEEANRGSGMGFHIMEYRARIIGASVEIKGSPGEGTVVTCKFRGKNAEH